MTILATSLTLPEAFGYSVLGFAIVFVVLIVLWVIVAIMAKAVNAANVKTETAGQSSAAVGAAMVEITKAAADPAPGTAGEIILKNVSEKDAALIMAIVANKMSKPLNELRFKSITEVNDDEI